MAHKVIVPPKKNYIPQFLKQRDINSYSFVFVAFQTQRASCEFSQSSVLHCSEQGRPFATAASSYLEFPACKTQKFGPWANIRPLLEKAKKLTICIGNSAPLRTFLLKKFGKIWLQIFQETKTIYWPLLSYLAENQPGVPSVLYETIWEGKVHCRECSCRHCYKVLGKTLRLT